MLLNVQKRWIEEVIAAHCSSVQLRPAIPVRDKCHRTVQERATISQHREPDTTIARTRKLYPGMPYGIWVSGPVKGQVPCNCLLGPPLEKTVEHGGEIPPAATERHI